MNDDLYYNNSYIRDFANVQSFGDHYSQMVAASRRATTMLRFMGVDYEAIEDYDAPTVTVVARHPNTHKTLCSRKLTRDEVYNSAMNAKRDGFQATTDNGMLQAAVYECARQMHAEVRKALRDQEDTYPITWRDNIYQAPVDEDFCRSKGEDDAILAASLKARLEEEKRAFQKLEEEKERKRLAEEAKLAELEAIPGFGSF